MATSEQRIRDAVSLISAGTKSHLHTEVDEDGDPVVYMFVSQPPDEIMCPICMDVMKDAVITPYGHSYCKSCVERYIQTSGLCPLTRKPLTEANLTPNLLARTIVDELEVYCPNGIKFGDGGVWQEDPDGCEEKVKFGLRKAHLKSCLHANVECPAGGAKCGPVARIDLELHLEEECQFSGRNRANEASENYQRASGTLFSFAVAAAVALLLLAGLVRSETLGHSASRAFWPILALLSLPAGMVGAAVWLESRIADVSVDDKTE